MRELIAGLARDGTTIFLSSHVLPEVEQLCHRVAILQRGRIIAEGETQAMLQQGERLYVRFEGEADAARARTAIVAAWPAIVATDEGPSAISLGASAVRGSELIRALAAAEIYPAEVGVRRQSLEDVFIELTAEPGPGAVAGSAA